MEANILVKWSFFRGIDSLSLTWTIVISWATENHRQDKLSGVDSIGSGVSCEKALEKWVSGHTWRLSGAGPGSIEGNNSTHLPENISNEDQADVEMKAEKSDVIGGCDNEDLEEVDEEEIEEDDPTKRLSRDELMQRLKERAEYLDPSLPDKTIKPSKTYSELIQMAILNSSDNRATLSEIYNWIRSGY